MTLNNLIGKTAEQIRAFLNGTGDVTVVSLQRKFGISECLFNQAIGWLVCQGVIEIRKQGRFTKIHPID